MSRARRAGGFLAIALVVAGFAFGTYLKATRSIATLSVPAPVVSLFEKQMVPVHPSPKIPPAARGLVRHYRATHGNPHCVRVVRSKKTGHWTVSRCVPHW